MGLLEHRCLFCIVTWSSLSVFAVSNTKLVLKIAHDPHLADDVTIQWHVCALEEFHEEARSCAQCQ